MHTVDLLAHALNLAERLGYEIRRDWLGGTGGGHCEIKGRKVFFLDLALSATDQLEQILAALRHEPRALTLPMAHPLSDLLQVRKSA
jgi:hypothetical protein